MVDKEEIIRLIIKRLGKAITSDESVRLDGYLKNYPEEMARWEIEAFIKLKTAGQPDNFTPEELKEKNTQLWENIHRAEILNEKPNNIQRNDRIVRFRSVYWTAACICFILIGIAAFFIFQKPQDQLIAQTAFGDTQSVDLPDGTKVKLNAGSTLYIDQQFNTDTRKVKLIGEAYFQVVSRPNAPFLVEVGNIKVEVLGTEFNVKAYPNENIETTLIQGRVAVNVNEGERIILKPLEKLTVATGNLQGASAKSKRVKVSEITGKGSDDRAQIAWLSNRFAFSDDRFGDVVHQLERKYDVHFRFQDSTLQNEKINGVLEHENLIQSLTLLKRIVAFDFEQKQDTIIIRNAEK
ncbi:FecR family protein [Olivibacter domesticus]|uniref:FecR family protein n=1 Tax=Olivibacter domesticus TaxID=407022 RepID=A0A1H7H3W8_OLID1|nr:FecR domain-containing protein [Olivibacter domesticus]SEK45103.1 FecR family protein [Olivibacter domesticus]